MKIGFYGSSLVSAYWNGAATYYRGIIRELARKGHDVTFFEPDIYDRQANRDIADPDWAKVVVYDAHSDADVVTAVRQAHDFDVVIKTSGVGAYDNVLEQAVIEQVGPLATKIFWDVDAPATLERVDLDPADQFRDLIPQYDLILTYGGGDPVVNAYKALGAVECVPIYNVLDTETHHPTEPDQSFEADLALLANRLPDREARIDEFFLYPASKLPERRFLLGGSGWDTKAMPDNVNYIGHVFTKDHNAFNSTPLSVQNVNRDSMARFGFSPPTRVFEAAGAGACLITDAWEGVDMFLEPGEEVLVAGSGDEVVKLLADLSPEQARKVGDAALERVLSEHTYAHRVDLLEELLQVNVKGVAV